MEKNPRYKTDITPLSTDKIYKQNIKKKKFFIKIRRKDGKIKTVEFFKLTIIREDVDGYLIILIKLTPYIYSFL
jgi:hypothetical protein